ncbi:uncharacterized protein PHALS_03693 [Plasmopara halstedii]|uniref:Uncharacterized protein n=1 Tax=Plasmopara halstedii TaxID=4781 RepID=A0A0P1AX57_PLAHL|nr:uncharacterized protein PHALS_03693 [Plasmopara halstedii]CEG47029.1 hypothetical protein PHALS_03693 [Plasmopara halstedii]|eukprot:XP_024583398.1 hypothetical protein PHALS_03693 [Plasmopara halstedii]
MKQKLTISALGTVRKNKRRSKHELIRRDISRKRSHISITSERCNLRDQKAHQSSTKSYDSSGWLELAYHVQMPTLT